MSFKAPEQYRLSAGECKGRQWPASMGTTEHDGNNGVFVIPTTRPGRYLKMIAGDGAGWEHVSISLLRSKRSSVLGQHGTPTWSECCIVKDLFWGPEDVVMQLHPKHSEYVNYHSACLHLWRPSALEPPIPTPPSILVGPLTGPK